MPMADLFAPDVNFVASRSVYPTASGGTTASAAGAMSATTNTMGVDDAGNSTPGTAAASAPITTSGQSVYWWLGLLVFLGLMVFVARKAGGEEEFRSIRPTAYNFLTITLTSIVGIVALKVLAVRFPVPGASNVILAV